MLQCNEMGFGVTEGCYGILRAVWVWEASIHAGLQVSAITLYNENVLFLRYVTALRCFSEKAHAKKSVYNIYTWTHTKTRYSL